MKNIIKKMSIGLMVSAFMFGKPATVEALSVPVEGGTVTIETIVEEIGGQRVLNRNDDGTHYVLYVFDGQTIKRQQGEQVVWINGKAAPFRVRSVDGVWVPKPAASNALSHTLPLPEELITPYLGYAVEDGHVILKETEPVDIDKPAEEETPVRPPTIDDEEKEEIPSQPPREDSDEADVPINDTDNKDDTTTSEKDADETETVNELPDSEKEPQHPIEDEMPSDNTEEDTVSQEEEEEVSEPAEIGRYFKSFDRADWWLYRSLEKAKELTLDDDVLLIHYSNENNVTVTHPSAEHTQEVNLHHSTNPIVQFEQNEHSYYTLELDFIDSRPQGLRVSHVQEYMNDAHEDINVSLEGESIQLFFEHETFNVREKAFEQAEEALIHLGITRFRVNRVSGRWDIWFELSDSSWSSRV